MTYDTSGRVLDCGFCGKAIPAGMPVYRLTIGRDVRCSTCAARYGLPLPEPVQGHKEARAVDRPDFRRFERQAVAKQVRGNLNDWRAKQAGEREPGQEG